MKSSFLFAICASSAILVAGLAACSVDTATTNGTGVSSTGNGGDSAGTGGGNSDGGATSDGGSAGVGGVGGSGVGGSGGGGGESCLNCGDWIYHPTATLDLLCGFVELDRDKKIVCEGGGSCDAYNGALACACSDCGDACGDNLCKGQALAEDSACETCLTSTCAATFGECTSATD